MHRVLADPLQQGSRAEPERLPEMRLSTSGWARSIACARCSTAPGPNTIGRSISTDPLQFTDTKPYHARLKASIAATGMKDAVVVARGCIDGYEAIVAAMEYGFIGGSMGVVVGEKITRGIERALATRRPMIIVSCSGGARMMEGALSLMQMAKICAALARLDQERIPYISILTDPTTGGRHRELRDARRSEHRRARSADRVRRTARHRADDPPEAA